MQYIWIYVSSFFLICCLLEFILLIKDNGIVSQYFEAFKRMNRESGMARTLLYTAKKIFSLVRQRVSHRNCPAEQDSDSPVTEEIHVRSNNEVHIAIELRGGLGDYLINANWYEYFRAKYVDDTVFVDIFAPSKSLTAVFSDKLPHTQVYAGKESCAENYDAVLNLARIPVVLSADEEKIKRLSPKLHEYIALCKRYMEENRLVWQNLPFLDGFHTAKCVSKGVKRIQEADVYGYLGITEEYKFAIQIKEDENAYLHSLGLDASPFITVHRGWDGAYTKSEHVKAWSLASCGDIIIKLKQQFPGYKIVLFGISKEQAPSPKGADINLLGKTSLEQVKILLKHAACHIDNEGGMVHLRHALHGGPSVVLFGPTSVDLFGYSENINLTSGACKHWCEWLTNDWMFTCTKTGRSGHPCMDAITSDDVIRSMKQQGNL